VPSEQASQYGRGIVYAFTLLELPGGSGGSGYPSGTLCREGELHLIVGRDPEVASCACIRVNGPL